MVIEVKYFLVNKRYDVNSSINIENVNYLVLSCEQRVLPKNLTKEVMFVVECVQISHIERL